MTIIQQMINKYNPITLEDKKNAVKEVLQEVVLAGLSKTDLRRRSDCFEQHLGTYHGLCGLDFLEFLFDFRQLINLFHYLIIGL